MADESGEKSSFFKDYVKAEAHLAACHRDSGRMPSSARLLGYLLDEHFHTGWIAITLMFLGAAGGFVHLFNYLSRSSEAGRTMNSNSSPIQVDSSRTTDNLTRMRTSSAVPCSLPVRMLAGPDRAIAAGRAAAVPWKMGWQSAALLAVRAASSPGPASL